MGSGFQVIPVGKKRLVQSVPGELSMDHAAVLQQAQVLAVVVVVVTSKSNKVEKQDNNFVCAAPFLNVHFFVVSARLRGEMPNFMIYGGLKQAMMKYCMFFFNLDVALRNSTPRKFAGTSK